MNFQEAYLWFFLSSHAIQSTLLVSKIILLTTSHAVGEIINAMQLLGMYANY